MNKSKIKLGRPPLADTILIIEEDRVLADLLKLSLGGHGFTVETTHQSSMVSDLIKEFNPLVVVFDLFLSGIDGILFLEKLNEAGKLDKRKVIIISALGFKEVIQQAVDLGAVDFVIKPIDSNLLIQKILNWAEQA